jgi:3-methyladenine DNA glycosylase Mpg
MADNGKSLLSEGFFLLEIPGEAHPDYTAGPRIGLGKACGEALDYPLRFRIKI